MTKHHIIATLEAAYKQQNQLFKLTGANHYGERCEKLRNQLILLYNPELEAGEVEHLNELMEA